MLGHHSSLMKNLLFLLPEMVPSCFILRTFQVTLYPRLVCLLKEQYFNLRTELASQKKQFLIAVLKAYKFCSFWRKSLVSFKPESSLCVCLCSYYSHS